MEARRLFIRDELPSPRYTSPPPNERFCSQLLLRAVATLLFMRPVTHDPVLLPSYFNFSLCIVHTNEKANAGQDRARQRGRERWREGEREEGRDEGRESRVFNFQAICPNAQRIDMFRRFVIGIALNCD